MSMKSFADQVKIASAIASGTRDQVSSSRRWSLTAPSRLAGDPFRYRTAEKMRPTAISAPKKALIPTSTQ